MNDFTCILVQYTCICTRVWLFSDTNKVLNSFSAVLHTCYMCVRPAALSRDTVLEVFSQENIGKKLTPDPVRGHSSK